MLAGQSILLWFGSDLCIYGPIFGSKWAKNMLLNTKMQKKAPKNGAGMKKNAIFALGFGINYAMSTMQD